MAYVASASCSALKSLNRDCTEEKNLGNGTRTQCPFTEHILFSGIRLHLHASQSGAFLSAVMLFLHQQVKLVQAEHPSTILFLIILQGLQQAYHSDTAFMFQLFHDNRSLQTLLGGKGTNKCEYLQFISLFTPKKTLLMTKKQPIRAFMNKTKDKRPTLLPHRKRSRSSPSLPCPSVSFRLP